MSALDIVEDLAGAAAPGLGWIRTALRVVGKVWPYAAIALLAGALLLTRGTLARVKAEHAVVLALKDRDSALADARNARRSEAAANSYAARTASRQPLIVKSKDTVTTYAQTPAGRASCLGADRVRGLDELDATLFTAPDPAGAARAVQPDADASPAGRDVDQR